MIRIQKKDLFQSSKIETDCNDLEDMRNFDPLKENEEHKDSVSDIEDDVLEDTEYDSDDSELFPLIAKNQTKENKLKNFHKKDSMSKMQAVSDKIYYFWNGIRSSLVNTKKIFHKNESADKLCSKSGSKEDDHNCNVKTEQSIPLSLDSNIVKSPSDKQNELRRIEVDEMECATNKKKKLENLQNKSNEKPFAMVTLRNKIISAVNKKNDVNNNDENELQDAENNILHKTVHLFLGNRFKKRDFQKLCISSPNSMQHQ